jgi:hypothetical protein
MLRLEVQSHERTHAIRLNGQLVGYLPSQSWADVWTDIAFPVPSKSLRAGYNELVVEVGQFIPDGQGVGDAWDELLFRNTRLERKR